MNYLIFANTTPLSTTEIRLHPPFSILISISVLHASIEFSANSFTTLPGLSITSPASIRLIVLHLGELLPCV
ncbi:hypothetical protein BIY23_00970 [Wolbachia pipientis]|uniref:Uncharacterized protein n=1 Tax=Wolbachia pipientis TaxID=955 RepID=A0A1E7QKP2_WOLPI|nr:hypothetical protein BIY23_00970 [Wolbachia pipientis]